MLKAVGYDRPDLNAISRSTNPSAKPWRTSRSLGLRRSANVERDPGHSQDQTVHRWCDNRATCFPPRCHGGNPISPRDCLGESTLRPSAASAEHESGSLQVPTSVRPGLAASRSTNQTRHSCIKSSWSTRSRVKPAMTWRREPHMRASSTSLGRHCCPANRRFLNGR